MNLVKSTRSRSGPEQRSIRSTSGLLMNEELQAKHRTKSEHNLG